MYANFVTTANWRPYYVYPDILNDFVNPSAIHALLIFAARVPSLMYHNSSSKTYTNLSPCFFLNIYSLTFISGN